MDTVAHGARRLVAKGKSAMALEALNKWSRTPTTPQILGTIPNLDRELKIMHNMFQDILAGRRQLDDFAPPHGSEAEEIRYYSVKDAIERQQRWTLIVADIRKRADL